MKLMRSRFRLLSLLLAGAFLLCFALCAVRALETAGVALPAGLFPGAGSRPGSAPEGAEGSTAGTPLPGETPGTADQDISEAGNPDGTPEALPGESSPDRDAPRDSVPGENPPEATDNRPETEYNVFGL